MATTVDTEAGAVSFRPGNDVPWADLDLVFGERGDPASCHCQWLKTFDRTFTDMPREERTRRFRAEVGCDDPDARETTGVVAYRDGEPVGWVAVESRPAFVRLRKTRVAWAGRDEDRTDEGVWAIPCFVVRKEYRRQGISHALVVGAVEHARQHGARAVEGYPMQFAAGKEDVWGELFVGPRSAFVAAGFRQVTHPTVRRYVMRLELR
ncbi:GNAT family N-acetyltransferase [Curtobacterium sp. VKM Ac-2922]|uniref:GNAT family N-acetyltransferase n=1 Tax=Curtobacterium sp. VKM Ac-2922 TaxID=2929475 RepID=UPI001FB210A0|nr:GNAT family N-acetyltransferase [Curtobacterium sp. VKM Ac-2922]MCJ1714988.1 GNAT family N-acetyltransferase [Curtobacterium sp. VKM Ac-2922]